MSRTKHTPATVIRYVAQGNRSKDDLARLLKRRARASFLDACARIERRYTRACVAANGLCPDSDCTKEGAICLVPLFRAGREYRQAYAAVWGRLFAEPEARAERWQEAVAGWRIRS